MKRSNCFIILFLIFFLVTLMAIDIVKIKSITDNPYHYRQSEVFIRGTILQYGDESLNNSQYYYLRDDWGGLIKVFSGRDLPEISKRYQIRGVVFINDKGEVNLIEQEKTSLEISSINADDDIIYYLIGAALVLLLLIVVLFLFMRRTSPYPVPIPGPTTYTMGTNKISRQPDLIEGATIKMTRPPAGTLKLLPGRLEVVAGDDQIKDIRFYKSKNQEETEMTFGRSGGPNYTHIQLKSNTVSAKQAKLVYTNGKYTLINYSTVNPTIVNDIQLANEGSIILQEGTRIEMGNVIFIFHAK